MGKNELVQLAVSKSRRVVWLLRLGSFIMMVAGICLFFWPITTLLGYIPLVGGFLGNIAGFVIFVGALIVCVPLYIIAFSIAWLWYHPKVGIPILILGVSIFVVLILLGNKDSSQENKAAEEIAKEAALIFLHLRKQ